MKQPVLLPRYPDRPMPKKHRQPACRVIARHRLVASRRWAPRKVVRLHLRSRLLETPARV